MDKLESKLVHILLCRIVLLFLKLGEIKKVKDIYRDSYKITKNYSDKRYLLALFSSLKLIISSISI